jgi:hypothetical protein
LKPDNILLSSTGTIKLTDFGGSTDFSLASTASKRNGFVGDTQGTWAFWAPEICGSDDLPTYSAFHSDVWAAGVVLFVMLYGVLPFWHDDMETLFELIENRMKHPEIQLTIPDEKKSLRSSLASEMVETVLIGNPENRPSIQTCQSHPWVQSNAGSNSLSSSANDHRSRLMRMASNQRSVADFSDEELSLENAITPGHAVYISKLLFRKLIKKSTESFQKFAAVIASLDEDDEDRDRHRYREREGEGHSDEENDSSSSAAAAEASPEKGNSFRNYFNVFSLGNDTSSASDAPASASAVMTSNPLKSVEEFDSIAPPGAPDADAAGSDSGSDSSSSDDDWTAWTRDFFEAPQELFRRLTSDSVPPFLSSLTPSDSVSSLVSSSSSASGDMNSFQRNSHQWNLISFKFPKTCSYCDKTIWPSLSFHQGSGNAESNVFKCQFCSKIYHQKCCYEEEELCTSETLPMPMPVAIQTSSSSTET